MKVQLTDSPGSDKLRIVIRRHLQHKLRSLARKFPLVTLMGPRQSGKTTLCRATFPAKAYVSLEDPDTREYALKDPRGFLADHAKGAILDEVQRAPGLLSYLQTDIDRRPTRGRFILTGSANLALLESVTQSLAGRTALLTLLPLGLDEVRRFGRRDDSLYGLLWRGSYPAVYDRELPPNDWYAAYVGTYVERDVRQMVNVGNLLSFQTFLKMCAARAGQLLNLSALGADCGISHVTARAWVSILEASFLVHRLPPFHSHLNTRLIKAPKLHFFDSGIVCYLLGIRDPQQLRNHPLRGAIFETWAVSEIAKARLHRGLPTNLCFYRDRKGLEVDAVVEAARELIAVETKSGQTVASDFFSSLDAFAQLIATAERASPMKRILVYGGSELQHRGRATVLPWSMIDRLDWERGTLGPR